MHTGKPEVPAGSLPAVMRTPTGLLATALAAGVIVLAGCAAAPATHPAGTAPPPAPPSGPPAAAPGGWGAAQAVPGTAALNQGGQGDVTSVSCASAGNCTAGGQYLDGSGHAHAFVVSEVNGTWQQAGEVPGIAGQGPGGSTVNSVSCASAGNCSAVGIGGAGTFAVSQVHGTWQQVQVVPRITWLSSVSCASAGNCGAAGFGTSNSGNREAFVVNDVNGTWGQAEEVPGTAALNDNGQAEVSSVSCASAGNCIAGGDYASGPGHDEAFVVSEVNGTWQHMEEVPGTAALNKLGQAEVMSVSCASAGNCGAGGSYDDGSGHKQAFVASEVNGTWGQAEEVPGTAALNKNGQATVASVSCASAGNCSAAGGYGDSSGGKQVFVVSEVNGTWGQAEEVPGIAALNQGGNAKVSSVSCASAGNCVAGGNYSGGSGQPVFVVSEVHGAWQRAEEVPGLAALAPHGFAGQLNSVSCAPAGGCSAAGYYVDGFTARTDTFVASKS